MPVIIRTRGVKTNADSEFDVYARAGDKRKASPLVIEGESLSNPAIAYEGAQDSEQKFCLLTKDKKTGKVELIDTPLFEVNSYVKSLREKDSTTAIRQSGVKNWQQRTALGQAFGTKKAKTAINDIERNRLDADMLDGLEHAIVDNVKERTQNMPSSEQRQKAAEAERPIPEYNAETKNVAEIYPLSSIVPEHEYDQIAPIVDQIVEASTGGEDFETAIANILPFNDSDFINARIEQVISDDSNVKPRLQVLVYLSFLRAIYQHRRASSRQKLIEQIGPLPSTLYDGVLERFTVPRAGRFGQSKERSFVFDPYHIDKLMSFILTLSLHANSFQLDVTPVAHELSVKSSKLITLLRNLGCSSRPLNASEAQARHLSGSQAQSHKIATLEAPLSLPDVVKHKRN